MSRAARVWAGSAAMLLVAAAGLVTAAPRTPAGFPHAAHERLFPVCETCHSGVLHDDTARSYPVSSSCDRCHDGTRAVRVLWREPSRQGSNLRFLHGEHLRAAADPDTTMTCRTCHAQAGATGRMAVERATPERCIACHEHRADTHLALVADCSRCHVTLAAAREIASGRIARFPRPAWHAAEEFLSTHATTPAPADASCAVCHARETCERCHANAAELPWVQALPRDDRVAALEVGRIADYPLPASHAADEWHLAHGRSARGENTACANCHTQPSCTGCHMSDTGAAARTVRRLPAAVPGMAPGVDPVRITRATHSVGIVSDHGRLAASGQLDCAQCHTRQQCASCHAASDSREFHAPNFIERHAVDVFAGRGECQSCHSTETFCRACHAKTGVAAQNMKSSFHDGQSNWVLSHGRAARLGLESCASCHRQNDCVQCHSAAGGWGVSPHGPGFSGRGSSRSSASCRLCHRTDPSGGSR
jgi:predicted CXXCH cytochrome family protein